MLNMPQREGNNIKLTFNSVKDYPYEIQVTDKIGSAWKYLDTVKATGTSYTYTTPLTADMAFYRVVSIA